MSRKLLWGAIIVLLLALLAYAVGRNIVLEPYTLDTGYQDAARRNDWLAAERLLTRLDITAVSVRDLNDLNWPPAPQDTLLLATPGYAIDRTRSEQLLDWVAAGGHLLLTVYDDYEPGDGGDALLDHFGVASLEHPSRPTELDLQLTPDGDTLTLWPRGPYLLADNSDAALIVAGEEAGAHLLRYGWGDGYVTILSDFSMFSNERLGDHDHADLLWQLLEADTRQGTVWLQYLPRVPSLTELLWRYGWMPLLGLLLTLACAVWAYSGRLGPILVPRVTGGRSLAEHIQASGRFLWRQGVGATLVTAAQQRLFHAAQRRLPQWRQLDSAERARQLSAVTGLPPEQIMSALRTDAPKSEREFYYLIQLLHRIRKQLP